MITGNEVTKVTLEVKVPRYKIHTFDIALRNGYAYIPTGIEVIMKYQPNILGNLQKARNRYKQCNIYTWYWSRLRCFISRIIYSS